MRGYLINCGGWCSLLQDVKGSRRLYYFLRSNQSWGDASELNVIHTFNCMSLNCGIWVGPWMWGCLVTWSCYQLIGKPGNKTATPPWPYPNGFLDACGYCLGQYFVVCWHQAIISTHLESSIIRSSVILLQPKCSSLIRIWICLSPNCRGLDNDHWVDRHAHGWCAVQ